MPATLKSTTRYVGMVVGVRFRLVANCCFLQLPEKVCQHTLRVVAGQTRLETVRQSLLQCQHRQVTRDWFRSVQSHVEVAAQCRVVCDGWLLRSGCVAMLCL